MARPGFRNALTLFSLGCMVFVGGCGTSDAGPNSAPATAVAIISGDGQSGFVGVTLATPLAVRVTATNGDAVAGVTVTFRVTTGSATVTPASAVTDADGRAQTTLRLGNAPGQVQVTATVEGTNLSVVFVAVAGSTTTTVACQSGAATLPAVSSITVGLAGTGICLGGGTTGADYTLIAFNASTVGSSNSSVDVTGRGIVTNTSPVITPAFSRLPGSEAFSPRAPDGGSLRAAFDARLRLSAVRDLTPLMPSARRYAKLRPGALHNAIPSSVSIGQILRLNVNSDDPCDNASYRFGRVVAITAKAIIVSDTLNPPNGFTDAQFQSVGVTFDTLVDPLDRAAFGEPSDVDHNTKTVIFYTSAVNALTPRGSQEYIGGFFYERDLFPTTATQDLQACLGSNVGEMFYMLAPDPTGLINGNIRKTTDVQQITIGTVAHEYQHLINAAHRLYITDADFEEVWLNEGMAHIAEELLYYRVSGLTPRQNLTSARVRATQALVNAFNSYQNPNFGRHEEYLRSAPNASPYGNDDSLKTRGATWGLLRYLADHRGADDGDTWTKLVNGPATGLPNLRNVFGTNLTTQMRDWATAVYTDDFVTTTDTRFLQPSWNYRSIYTQAFSIPYPLKFTSLADGIANTQVILGGGSAYLRFTVIAGAQGSIDWLATGGAPASPLLQWTLVRTR